VDVTLELKIDTLDEVVVRDAEDALAAAPQAPLVRRWPRARVVDPLTIFALVGGVVGLVDALLSLQERWISRRRSGRIRLVNEGGEELEVTVANRAQLEEFLERSGTTFGVGRGG
jgi:hypothetical protein